jgi:hypothetical protein
MIHMPPLTTEEEQMSMAMITAPTAIQILRDRRACSADERCLL